MQAGKMTQSNLFNGRRVDRARGGEQGNRGAGQKQALENAN